MHDPEWGAIGAEVGLDVRSAVSLGEGWSGWVYRTTDEFVFKFQTRAGE